MDAQLYRWVRLSIHCALTGDTPDAVHARRRKGIWRDGIHSRVGPDGNLYVSPEAFNRWVEGTDHLIGESPAQQKPADGL